MFDRTETKFTDNNNWHEELHRFNNDKYYAKYCASLYNPEFRMRITRNIDYPIMDDNGLMLDWMNNQNLYENVSANEVI